MGVAIEQWRSIIGSWERVCVHTVLGNCRHTRSPLWFMLLTLMVLLVIGGVEINPGPVQTFEKTKGFADMAGENYEWKMSALLFLRAIQRREKFQLSSNMKAAGSFDDIVLTLGGNSYFLQLKHKQNSQVLKLEHLAHNKNFRLQKYLESLKDIKQRWENNPDLQKCGKFENAKFLIYTNAQLDGLINIADSTGLLSIVGTGGVCASLSGLFDTLLMYKGVLLKAVSSENITIIPELCNILHKMYDKKSLTLPSRKQLQAMLEYFDFLEDLTSYKQFVSQLYLCTSQAPETALQDLIKQEFHSDILLSQLLEAVQKWWRTSNCYLTENWQEWQYFFSACRSSIIQANPPIDVKFKKQYCNAIGQKLILGNRKLYLITSSTSMSVVKVLQSTVNTFLVNVKTLEARLSEVMAVWKLGMSDVMVVEGEMKDISILDKLICMLESRCLVIISDTDQTHLYQKWNFVTLRDTFCLDQLVSESERQILEREVVFQGAPVKLNSLAEHSFLQTQISAGVMTQIHNTLKIGQKLLELDSCYLQRTFVREEIVNDQVFREQQIVLAVTGASEARLTQLVSSGEQIQKYNPNSITNRFCRYWLIEGEDEFVDLCKVNNNIHWNEASKQGFRWKQTKGDISPIIKNLKQESISYGGAEEIIGLPNQVVLVIAEPGMGKTTEMVNIAHVIKQKDPSTWVVSIDLNQCSTLLDQQISALKFLHTVTTLKSDFEKCLFDHKLQSEGNIVILLDGFDEISPHFSQQAFYLLKKLSEFKVRKIFITSRPVISQELQETFSTLAFSFSAFNHASQNNFLFKYWKQISLNSSRLSEFITSLLQLIETTMNDRWKEFAGIPLQCRMLAEVFQNDASHFCKSGKVTLPQSLDILQLYDKFIDKKIQVYFQKIYGNIYNTCMLQMEFKSKKQLLLESYMNCAMFAYFGDTYIRSLQNSNYVLIKNNEFLIQFNSGHDKIGIVTHFVGERAVFVHRTFTEYFVAMWHFKTYQTELCSTRQIYLKPDFNIIQTFLDRLLAAEYKLHTAVLNTDLSEIKNLLLEQNTCVNQEDKGGRTALFLAIMNLKIFKHSTKLYSKENINYSIIDLLLEQGADVNSEDKVLHLKPLRLAEDLKSWCVVDKLLEKEADDRELVWIRTNVEKQLGNRQNFLCFIVNTFNCYMKCECKNGICVQYCMSMSLHDVMCTALERGYVNLVKFILKCGVSVQSGMYYEYYKTTMLHIASECGQIGLVQFFVENRADVDASSGKYKRTSLMQAAELGHLQVAELLVKHGASVNAIDSNGRTAVSLAAEKGKHEIVELLLKFRADVDICDRYNVTPLMQAAMHGHLKVAEVIVKHGCRVNVRDARGYSALLLAGCYKHDEVEELLRLHGAME